MGTKSILKKVIVLGASIIIISQLTGCMRKFDKPEFVTISPSQTAFLVPLVGDTSSQGAFGSEELLAKTKVATKEVQVPHRWVKTGIGATTGEYRKSATLIVVERKPVTRNWTSDTKTGTNVKDEGIKAETKESIAFSANMNATAQIDEQNATKFLYRYNNATLESIMDSEIHSRIATKFAEECSKYSLADLLINKAIIMESIRKDTMTYFTDRGITVTTVGIAGDLTYTNPEIQKSIDDKFKAEKGLEIQKATNETVVSKAKADAEAIAIQSSTIDKQIRIKELENQTKAIEKWDGKMPQVTGGNSNILNIPLNGATATK